MNRISLSNVLIGAVALVVLAHCGGDEGGITIVQPTTAVLTLATAVTGALPDDTIINGYDVTISLPAGVTVKSTTAPPQTDEGVVLASGAATDSSIAAVYSEATGTLPARVRILITKADGFSAGEFSTVNCDIAAGHYPTATDFQQPAFEAGGWNTATESTVDLTGQLSMTASAVIK